MEIEFRGQKRTLAELKYLDAIEVSDVREKEGLRAATKKMLTSLGFSGDEVESLTLNEGLALQKVIDEVTKDFQNPVKNE